MKFSYAYKTSDGIRHEAEIDAPSRDDAFAILRERGIRPIKVVSLAGTKANGAEHVVTRKRFVIAALFIGLVGGTAVTLSLGNADFRDRRVVSIDHKAAELLSEHSEAMLKAGSMRVRDVSIFTEAANRDSVLKSFEVGYRELGRVRDSLRELFSSAYEELSAEQDQNGAVVKQLHEVYERTMGAVDLEEARWVKMEKAYRIVDDNRGKWRVNGKALLFDEKSAGREYAFLMGQMGL